MCETSLISKLKEWETSNSALEQLARENKIVLDPGYCRISTLKPMLGHMECVSAFGALFKIIRSIQTNTLHKIINLDEVNPYLNTENRPCRLAKDTEAWNPQDKPRLASFHSYGSGGNNAHVLIEEYKTTESMESRNRKRLSFDFKTRRCWVDVPEKRPDTQVTTHSAVSHKKRIGIIGAGPSGLVMAKSLLEEGHQPVIFEKQHALGGLWVLNDNKTAGAYKKTRFQSSKFTSVFSDFYLDTIKSNFYSVNEVKEYLDSYAAHFKLNSLIHYQSEVIAVAEKENSWELVVKQGDNTTTHLFDGVALCQGSFWQPNIPAFKGLEQFKGKVIHSAQYYDDTPFKDKRVLVVGNGVSAMDIAQEAAAVANKVVWSRRSSKLILPRMVGFVPNDCQSPASLMIEANRINIMERLKISMPEYYQTYVKTGILPTQEEFEKNPIVHINDGIIQLVADGVVVTKKHIDHFTESGCLFLEDDAEHEDFDVVVLCTGYKNFGGDDARYDYIKNISVANDFSMGIFYEKNPSLVNTSVLPIAFTGSFYFLEMVARWYAQIISGNCLLTDDEKKQRITPDHYLIMAPISAVLFGLRLGLFPKPEEEFNEFWRLLNYPAFPMIQRLRGFHSNDNADQQLKQFIQKSYVKTDLGDPALKELKSRILAGLGQNNLDKLLLKGEISAMDFEQAQAFFDRPCQLNWESQYIKAHRETSENQAQVSLQYNPLVEKLVQYVSVIMRVYPADVDVYKNLSEYGFDSISLTGFAREITLAFPFIQLESSTFLEYSTLDELSSFLYEKYESEFHQSNSVLKDKENHKIAAYRQYPELLVLQSGTKDRLPVFWFHAALGTVQMYLSLADALDKDVPFYAIQARGVIDKQTPLDNLVDMAKYYSDMIREINHGKPFQLGGFSQGGVIAYEVARQLQLAGEKVKNIIMIDAPFPPVISFLSVKYRYLLTLLNLLQMHNLAQLADINSYPINDIGDKEYLAYLIDLGIKKGLPSTRNQLESMLDKFFHVSDANIRSMHGYSAMMLPVPEQLECFYVQRQSSQQFFSNAVSEIAEFKMQNQYYQQSNCAQRWSVLLPNFNLYKTNALNHFSFFEDPAVFKEIIYLCKQVYRSGETIDSAKSELERESV